MKCLNSLPGIPEKTVLLATALAVWIWSAYYPVDFETWFVEQIATAIGIATFIWLARRTCFSRLSYLALWLLFCLHTIGTHYTYSLTPYEQLSLYFFGSSPNDWFGWERNHYDRFVHFAYGLLAAQPIHQALQQALALHTKAHFIFGIHIILSTSALYELAEWAAAIFIGGDLGTAYLGTQGDVWDAQTDIALAAAGWLTFLSIHLCRRVIPTWNTKGSVFYK